MSSVSFLPFKPIPFCPRPYRSSPLKKVSVGLHELHIKIEEWKAIEKSLSNHQIERLEELGRGSYAIVYKAKIGAERAIGALKIPFSLHGIENPERQVLSKLNQKNVPHIPYLKTSFSVSLPRNRSIEVLAMNLASGKTLHNLIKSQSLSTSQILSILHQSLEFLAHCQTNKCTHGDLKPENMMWGNEELTHLDFGISGFWTSTSQRELIQSAWYRAPEVVLRLLPYKNVDIWSVGCIFYELYTGKPLFPVYENDNLHLQWMFKRFGYPPTSFLKQSSRFHEFFLENGDQISFKTPLEFSLPTWKEEMHKAGKRQGDAPYLVNSYIGLIEKMLGYQERILPKDAIQDLIFQDFCCVSLQLNSPPSFETPFFLKFQSCIPKSVFYSIRLDQPRRCLHLPIKELLHFSLEKGTEATALTTSQLVRSLENQGISISWNSHSKATVNLVPYDFVTPEQPLPTLTFLQAPSAPSSTPSSIPLLQPTSRMPKASLHWKKLPPSRQPTLLQEATYLNPALEFREAESSLARKTAKYIPIPQEALDLVLCSLFGKFASCFVEKGHEHYPEELRRMQPLTILRQISDRRCTRFLFLLRSPPLITRVICPERAEPFHFEKQLEYTGIGKRVQNLPALRPGPLSILDGFRKTLDFKEPKKKISNLMTSLPFEQARKELLRGKRNYFLTLSADGSSLHTHVLWLRVLQNDSPTLKSASIRIFPNGAVLTRSNRYYSNIDAFIATLPK